MSVSSIALHYDQLCNMVIRPPRLMYDISELGPRNFIIQGKYYRRSDFALINPRGLTLQCSHLEPIEESENWKLRPCVIYCHGNGGGRLDALESVRTLLPHDITVMALDFSGSGLSEGEYVSLGFFEKDDVSTVVTHLRSTGRVSTIGLWGRSMGAVTALLYAKEDPSVAGMVLDSPFTNLSKVAEELVTSIAQKVPRFVVSLGLRIIRGSIKKKAKFDIKCLDAGAMVHQCFIPALFVHAKDDNFVKPHHSETLYERYGGDKNRILVEGDHNSIRPSFFTDSVVIFFMNTLGPALNGEGIPPPRLFMNTQRKASDASPNPQLPTSPQRKEEDTEEELVRRSKRNAFGGADQIQQTQLKTIFATKPSGSGIEAETEKKVDSPLSSRKKTIVSEGNGSRTSTPSSSWKDPEPGQTFGLYLPNFDTGDFVENDEDDDLKLAVYLSTLEMAHCSGHTTENESSNGNLNNNNNNNTKHINNQNDNSTESLSTSSSSSKSSLL